MYSPSSISSPVPADSLQKERMNPLVSPPENKLAMMKPKQHPLVSPPPRGKRTARPKRRSSLTVVWPPPKPESSRTLDTQSYHHAGSLKDISTHSRTAELSVSLHDNLRRTFEHSPATQTTPVGSTNKLSPVPHSCPAGYSGAVSRNDIMSNIAAPTCNDGSPGQQPQSNKIVSPAAARANFTMVSPGTVQEKLKTFSVASPGNNPNGSTQMSPDSAGIRRTPPPPLKKSPSKRLKNRWPPVTVKKAPKRRVKPKDEIQTQKVKSTLNRFESQRSLSSAIDSLPFGGADDDNASLMNGGGVGGPSRAMSSRQLLEVENSISPDQVKARLSHFEQRSRSMNDLGNSSHHDSSSSSRNAHRLMKKGSFTNRGNTGGGGGGGGDAVYSSLNDLSRTSSHRSMNPIYESSPSEEQQPEIVLPTGQKLPPPTRRRSSKKKKKKQQQIRRTNYCIRYEGPTLLSLIDVYGNDLGNIPEADERFQKSSQDQKDESLSAPSRRISESSPLVGQTTSRKRISGSENDSMPCLPRRRSDLVDADAPDMPKRTSNASWEDYDEFADEEGEEASLDGMELLTRGGKRPDVWITPVKPRGSWMVKRVWDQEEADDKEQEHFVDGEDLMGSIRDLLGVPELTGDDELNFKEQNEEEEKDGAANKDNTASSEESKQFFMKMVFDIGGEVDEADEETQFCKMGLAEEISHIVKETTYLDEVEEITEDDADNARMVYRIGEEGADDSDDEREFTRMTASQNHLSGGDNDDEDTNAAKMVYGRGEGDNDSDDDDEGNFKKMERQAAAASTGPDAKMVYGNDGTEEYDSDDERVFNKVDKQGTSRRPGAKMVYGNDGTEEYDSDDERVFNKVDKQGTSRRPGAKMVYGNDETEEYDSDDERAFNKVEQQGARRPGAKMVYGNDGTEDCDSDDERVFTRSSVPSPEKKDESTDDGPSNSRMVYGNGEEGDESDDDERDYNCISNNLEDPANLEGSSSYDPDRPEDSLSHSAREIPTGSSHLVDDAPRQRKRHSSAGDLKKGTPDYWVSGVTGVKPDKSYFKEKSWVIHYGSGGTSTEDTTEFSSTSTNEVDETEKQPRILPWEKKVISPKKEKKEVKLWFM